MKSFWSALLSGLRISFLVLAHFYVIQKHQQNSQKRGSVWIEIALGSIGIAAISSMLVVATLPPIETPNKSVAMLVGFITLAGLYFKFKQIVVATLTAAVVYGFVYTYVPFYF